MIMPTAPKKKRSTTGVKETPETPTTTQEDDTKKRGRKTKGSKIVTKQQIIANVTTPAIANVILNLKCSMTDLKEYNDKLSKMISNPLAYNSSAPPEVKHYDGEKTFGEFSMFNLSSKNDIDEKESNFFDELLKNETNSNQIQDDVLNRSDSRNVTKFTDEQYSAKLSDKRSYEEPNEINAETVHAFTPAQEDHSDVNVKDMSAKLKQLKIQLYKNTLHSEKKSACFWCTYDFDNAPCYIPKYEMDGTIYGYGSFCRPECAVAYLMKEQIDDSTKFDRYHLLNQIYSKVYECKKNIKPAPDPHYLLDKFYGNLTIQEYRRLLKTEHLLLVVDKPLTRILPELHEDSDDAFTKIYGIKASTGNASGVYKVKRQSEQPQGPSKASIIKNTFGIAN
jgi:hypothetical protein